jgi:DNA-binding CsgD family transcriptional regulator
LEATRTLLERGFEQLEPRAFASALAANSEIDRAPIQSKTSPFGRYLFPLRTDLVNLLAESYRRYFKLALANPSQTEGDPHKWALTHLQLAISIAWTWIHDWYVLACDGVPRGETSVPVPDTDASDPPRKGWLAPSWLFQISFALVGVGPLKEHHVPDRSSELRLGAAHTRLLLKGARRVFLWQLGSAFETVRNEETAAAGAMPAGATQGTVGGTKQMGPKLRLTGTEGLGPKKTDLSHYTDRLTEKQRQAFSLKYEYELGLAEIASRMGLDRKTAYEHIEAAKRKIDQARSSEKRKAHRLTREDE